MEEYNKLPKAKQDDIKDVGGFILGKLKDNKRRRENVLSRSAITLDMDYGSENIVGELKNSLTYRTLIYSTHKHRKSKPRLRLIIPLDRNVSPDEYSAISRMVASEIDMELFDDSTYEASRLMYWPSTSCDGDFVFEPIEGTDNFKMLTTDDFKYNCDVYVNTKNIDRFCENEYQKKYFLEYPDNLYVKKAKNLYHKIRLERDEMWWD